MLILFNQSGLFVSDHAVAPILVHSSVALGAQTTSVVSGAPKGWIRTVVSTAGELDY